MTNKEKCLDMWEWLATHPDMHKSDYFNANLINAEDIPISLCYACESVYDRKRGIIYCDKCPIQWTHDTFLWNTCEGYQSPYYKWIKSVSRKTNKPLIPQRRKYAKQIVHLIKTTWKE